MCVAMTLVWCACVCACVCDCVCVCISCVATCMQGTLNIKWEAQDLVSKMHLKLT